MGNQHASAHRLLQTILNPQRREDPHRPETIRAMPIVLHVDKASPPPRSRLLAAAARAAVGVCLDPRVSSDPKWSEPLLAWYDANIRKVVRRARGAKWRATHELPGVTVEETNSDGTVVAFARAFLPTAVSAVPEVLNKLQITGADLPSEAEVGPAPAGASYAKITLDAGLGMTVGKAAAQAAHAAQVLAAVLPCDVALQWVGQGAPLIVREVNPADFARCREAIDASAATRRTRWLSLSEDSGRPRAVIRDAGHTEVAPGSATAIAEWMPHEP